MSPAMRALSSGESRSQPAIRFGANDQPFWQCLRRRRGGKSHWLIKAELSRPKIKPSATVPVKSGRLSAGGWVNYFTPGTGRWRRRQRMDCSSDHCKVARPSQTDPVPTLTGPICRRSLDTTHTGHRG